MPAISFTAANVIAQDGYTPVAGIGGATWTQGQLMYQDTADDRYKLADANGASALIATVAGVALNAGAAGQPIDLASAGDVVFGSGVFTPGEFYILGTTPGAINPASDSTTGWYASFVGIAISATTLRLLRLNSGIAKS